MWKVTLVILHGVVSPEGWLADYSEVEVLGASGKEPGRDSLMIPKRLRLRERSAKVTPGLGFLGLCFRV